MNSMKIYTQRVVYGICDVFLSSVDTDRRKFAVESEVLQFRGKSRIDEHQWEPLRCYIDCVDEMTGEPLQMADFPSNTSGMFIVNKNAKDALKKVVAPYGQFLPLECKEDELYILNVYHVIDCVNLERSEILFRESLDPSRPNPFIESYEFDQDKIGDSLIFRLPYERETAIYFQGGLIDEIQKLGLTGFAYSCIWSSGE